MRRLLALLLLLAHPAAAGPPAALIEATEEASAQCTAAGGTPAILDGYRVTLDLNGDGIDDFLTDMARLECAGAWSAFCGSSGCPVTAWLSEPDGGHVRFDFGHLLGVETHAASPLPAVVARYAAPFCGETSGDCTRTWIFSENAPELPPIDAAPAPAGSAAPKPAPPAASEPPAGSIGGWTLRHVPGSSPVALGMGTGNVASMAIFCLSNQPFLAVTFHRPPDADSVALDFAFSRETVSVTAGFEETAGGAFVVPLAEGRLASRLAGRDTEVALRAGDEDEGVLSLKGSSRAIAGAVGGCGGL